MQLLPDMSAVNDTPGAIRYRNLSKKGVTVEAAIFDGKEGREVFCILHADPEDSSETAVTKISEALKWVPFQLSAELSGSKDIFETIFSRLYLSDPSNQAQYCSDELLKMSVIGQRPLSGGNPKASALLWLVERNIPKRICYSAHSESHVDPFEATCRLFKYADKTASAFGGSVARNCHRTWLFARDIDNNYEGVVKGRNNYFDSIGLTPDSHFITSTGIEGTSSNPHSLVTLDFLIFPEITDNEVTYLKGSTHLNPTAEYGVAFERGTAIDMPDRRLTMISGTASINNRGEIMYPGDVVAQTERMLTNVGVLLEEAGAGLDDLTHAIVYLPDPSDYGKVEAIL